MSPAPADRAFRADIQGMRALAVLAVVANHAGLPFATGGYVGVDVFFVISGYLITGQLLAEREKTGRVRFAGFYARRARRILPASFVVLAATVVAAMLWVPPVMRAQVLRDAIATALYLPNLAFAAQQTDYLADATPSLFQHYWSLGVEEQFYLGWPAFLVGAFVIAAWVVRRTGRRRMTVTGTVRSRHIRIMMIVVAVMAVVSFVSLVVCIAQTYSAQPWAFFSPWTRAWEFGVGAIIAVVARRPRNRTPGLVATPIHAVLAWSGLALIVACCIGFGPDTTFPGFAVMLPVVGAAAMILGGREAPRFGPTRMLALAPVQFLGAISYSLYLVHWPMLQLVQASVGYEHPLPLWGTGALALVAVPVAWLLYRFVEQPARRSKALGGAHPRRALLTALAGSAALAGACALALVVAVASPLESGRVAASTQPSAPPVGTRYVPANLTPDLKHAADDDPVLYADSCELDSTADAPHPCTFGNGKRTIALFGDSHAAQWFPALRRVAEKAGYRLITQTKSGCPAIDIEVAYKGAPYTSCDAWRSRVIAQLRANPPDAIVLADYVDPVFAHPGEEGDQWEHGMRSTVSALAAHSKVIVLADTPDLKVSPLTCLSSHLKSADACARRASTALVSATRAAQKKTAIALGVPLVDVNDYLCGRTCPAIIGDTLVYRDSHHLTATFAAQLAGPLGARLVPLL